jgi:hypothetical protein
MEFLASLVLTIHLLWILWVVFGAFWTRGRPLLTALHILSLVWGIVVELSPLPCPLTITEQFFERKVGTEAYAGTFLAHLLDRLVYPSLPEALLPSWCRRLYDQYCFVHSPLFGMALFDWVGASEAALSRKKTSTG